ncbi:hypothetical protein JCM11641_006462 [Rhodosporidiobolus odoratus]
MHSDADTVISDSEPECDSTAFPSSSGMGRRAAARPACAVPASPSASVTRASRTRGEELVLSSCDEASPPPPAGKPSTSRYFAASAAASTSASTLPAFTTISRSPPSKRPRIPSPPPAWHLPSPSASSSSSSSKRRASVIDRLSGSPHLSKGETLQPPRSVNRGAVLPAAAEQQPFVSTLELLRSTPSANSPREDVILAISDGDPEAQGPKPPRKKGRKKAEPAEERCEMDQPKKTRRKPPTVKKENIKQPSRTAKSTESAPSRARSPSLSDAEMSSASSASAASTSSSLPAPKSWKERFAFGVKSSNESLEAQIKVKKEEAGDEKGGKPGGGAARKKPWEVMEQTLATRPRERAPAPPKNTSQKVSGKAKVRQVVAKEDTVSLTSASSDDDDIIILPTRDSTSTAFLPLPSASLTTGSRKTSATSDKKRTSAKPNPLSFLPPPLPLPEPDLLRCLTSCALCSVPWASTKSLSLRQSHLRTCATQNAYTESTLHWLVEEQLLRLAEEAEDRRREKQEEWSLFDRTIGKGEGANPFRDVVVVGVEAKNDDGGEFFRAVREAQEELDEERKKVGVEKVVKVAREIRRARAAKKSREEDVKREDAGKGEGGDVAGEMPPATGRLRPDTDETRAAVAKRAEEMLGLAGGSGLTQVAEAAPQVGLLDQASAREQKQVALGSTGPTPLRNTQPFALSALAESCEKAGRASVVRLSSFPWRSASVGAPTRRKGKERECSLELSDGGQNPEKHSLWRVAAGREEDAELAERVVRSQNLEADSTQPRSPRYRTAASHHLSSPFSSPTRATAFAYAPDPAGANEIALSPSSAALLSSLAISSPSRSSHSPARARPLVRRASSIPPHARDLAHPYSPLALSPSRPRSRSHRSASPTLLSSPFSSPSVASLSRRQRRTSSLPHAGNDHDPPSSAAPLVGSPACGLQEDWVERKMGRLGLFDHRPIDEVGDGCGVVGRDGGETDVEAWLMEGGVSPGSGAGGQERGLGGGGREVKKGEESSEEETLESVVRRTASAKKTKKGSLVEPPTSPSPPPTALRTKRQPMSKAKTKAVGGRVRRVSPPTTSDSEDTADNFQFSSGRSSPVVPPSPLPSAATTASNPIPQPKSRAPTRSLAKRKSKKEMPDYAAKTLPQLQKEVAKYGFRASKEKAVVVEQLERVWKALNPEVDLVAEDEAVDTPVKAKKRVTKKAKVPLTEEGGEDGVAVEPQPGTKAKRGRKKQVVEDKEAEEKEDEDTRTSGEKLRELILKEENLELYCRILRYEPVHFDVFVALCKSANLKIAQTLLMRCLDEQSITFYTQDPTNGSRRRYK